MTDIMKKHQKVLFGILLMAEIALMVYMTWQYGAQWLDSDDSAEMILAELLSREGGILSKNWYYSTELRVLNTQLVMAPLFCLFSDWRVVRTVGTGVLLVILLFSYLFLCRSVKLGKTLIYFACEWANDLPRKILGYHTPNELFEKELDRIYKA